MFRLFVVLPQSAFQHLLIFHAIRQISWFRAFSELLKGTKTQKWFHYNTLVRVLLGIWRSLRFWTVFPTSWITVTRGQNRRNKDRPIEPKLVHFSPESYRIGPYRIATVTRSLRSQV